MNSLSNCHKMKILYIVLISLLIHSCEKDIDIEIPEKEPVLVVNSIFNTDSIWSVQISQSQPIKTPDSTIRYINNATVNLLDSTGNLIEKLEFLQGNYISPSGKKPLTGRKYQLSVEASGFEKASAISYIPDTNKLKSIKLSKGKSNDKRYNQMVDYLLFEATLSDNPCSDDYYIIEFIGLNTYDIVASKYVIEGNDNYFESFSSTVTEQYRVFFTDETFNGQEKLIKLKTNISSSGLAGNPAEFMPVCYLRLYSVSEQLYKYLISYYRQAESSEFEYTNNPIRVDNNIINGLGIFGGYTYKDIPIDKDALSYCLQ